MDGVAACGAAAPLVAAHSANTAQAPTKRAQARRYPGRFSSMVTIRARSLSIAFAVAAAACLVVAFVERHITTANAAGIGFEGVYFNRSVGSTHTVFSLSGNWLDPFKPLNPYLWVGAGAAFFVASAALAWLAKAPARLTAGTEVSR
ncbi:MAG: hypothetical protein QOJ29_1171 [Thermoleophilaceae bacterium]|nr:hypothetical protein [Thermoleophilaceae bacterium]